MPDPEDARSVGATLTPEGERKLAQAPITHDAVLARMITHDAVLARMITHDAVLARMITPHLTADDLRTLERSLGKIARGS